MDALPNELLWFLFGLVMMLGEIVTPGFVLIFFGVGAWLVSLLLWLGLPVSFTTQMVIFLVTSVSALLFFRKYGTQFSHGKVVKADPERAVDDIRGDRAVATSDIMPGRGGSVEYNGTHWSAESDSTITKGSPVEIVERKNLILTVKPIQ
ncbi:MAG: NfeD family protein [Bacteroidetes bacterium]|nr:NfeD family protein [Bacteroidota bacterium]